MNTAMACVGQGKWHDCTMTAALPPTAALLGSMFTIQWPSRAAGQACKVKFGPFWKAEERIGNEQCWSPAYLLARR